MVQLSMNITVPGGTGEEYDERSAGGIVFRKNDTKLEWLVVKTLALRTQSNIKLFKKPPRLLYKFPKGHVNPGEFLKETALREVEEEAWIVAKIHTKLGSNDYIIFDKPTAKKIVKKVTFFLMEFVGTSEKKHKDAEGVVGKEWLSVENAYKVLAYDSEKELLLKANEYVLNAL